MLGVSWPGSAHDSTPPRLRLVDIANGRVHHQKIEGRLLAFRVLGGTGVRYCTGRTASVREGGSTYRPCPEMAPATVSTQCADCAGDDLFKFVHTVHRRDFLPRDLEQAVMQPHWLYVATFAGGEHKVGTAADGRKWARLAEQGAIRARYVARAVDGRAVRVAEDLVTARLGVRQSVRAAAKATALCPPTDVDRLDRLNEAVAARVRSMLDDAQVEGCTPIDSAWDPPAGHRVLNRRDNRVLYPASLSRGHHGFTIDSCIGHAAFAGIAGQTFVVDLAALTGRRISFGANATVLPAIQSALF